MTSREKLHHLIDDLSEPDVEEALQYITWQQENGFAHLLAPQSTKQRSKGSQNQAPSTEQPASGGQLIFLNEIKRTQEYR